VVICSLRMMEGQVVAQGDNVIQGQRSAGGYIAAVKLPLELLRVCGEEGLGRKSFFFDTGAYAEHRGKGRNHLAHSSTGTG